jgi:hypothetical protein
LQGRGEILVKEDIGRCKNVPGCWDPDKVAGLVDRKADEDAADSSLHKVLAIEGGGVGIAVDILACVNFHNARAAEDFVAANVGSLAKIAFEWRAGVQIIGGIDNQTG